MVGPKHTLWLVALLSLFLLFSNLDLRPRSVHAQAPLPPTYDGFIYGDAGDFSTETIMIEAFFDPICPDSRDAWPPLKRALQHYGPVVSLIVHPFALPYHDNSYISCRALHVANNLNSSATYYLLEKFFKDQARFYNQQTSSQSKDSVTNEIVEFVAEAVGNSVSSFVEAAFSNRKTDLQTRVSFKYGCSRGVYGTPFFFVNGFSLPNAGSAVDYNGWRTIIDPLLSKRGLKRAKSYAST